MYRDAYPGHLQRAQLANRDYIGLRYIWIDSMGEYGLQGSETDDQKKEFR
jgi:hypothetical protein